MLNFHECYKNYAKDVYKFIFWLSGDGREAEDITSETFIKMWMNKDKIKTETLKSYLFTIARNLYLHRIRDRKKNLEPDENIPDNKPTPEKIAEVRSELQATIKAMQKLPEIDRTILIMHAQQNMSYREISLSTGLTIPAIKVKIHRARIKLQTYLRGDNNEN